MKCMAVVLWNQSVQTLSGLWLFYWRCDGLHCRYRKALESIMNLIRSTQSQQKGVRTPVVIPAHRGVFKIALLAVISTLPPTCPCVDCRRSPICARGTCALYASCAVQDNGKCSSTMYKSHWIAWELEDNRQWIWFVSADGFARRCVAYYINTFALSRNRQQLQEQFKTSFGTTTH